MSTITVTRTLHNKAHPFTIINSAIAKALPVEELGLLVKLLSMCDGWEISRQRLQRDYAVKPGQLKRLLPALVKLGHLRYERPVDPKTNRFNGSAVWKVAEQPSAFDVHEVDFDSVDAHGEESHEVDFDQVEIDEVETDEVETDLAASAERHGKPAGPPNIPLFNIPKAKEKENNNPQGQPQVAVVVEQETDAGEETIAEETETEPARPTLFAIYTDVFGKLSEFMGQKLNELCDKHSEPWLRAALIEAGYANAGSFSYVTSILERWQRQGYASPKHSKIEREKPRQPKNDFRGVESGTLPDADQRLPVHWPTDAKDDFHDGRETPAGPQDEDWAAAYQQLKLQLPRQDFEVCLRDARFLRVDDAGRYVIGVHNQMARDMLQHRLYRNVKRLLSDARGQDSELLFEAPDGSLIDSDLPVFVIREMEVAS